MKIIRKMFVILDLFLDHGDELTLEEMARFSGMNKSTVRRIALALLENGCLKQPVKRGRYSLGMKFLDYSGAIKRSNSVINIASPHLVRLSQKANETVIMALWDGIRAVLCQSFHADHPLKVVPDEGTRLGMHYTSVGKAILAEIPDQQLEHIFENGLERFTQNTITDLTALRNHLRAVRQEGVAFDDEEYYPGVRGIGAAIKNGEGAVTGAIGIVGPSIRLTRDRLVELVPLVKETAFEISRSLGYRNERVNAVFDDKKDTD